MNEQLIDKYFPKLSQEQQKQFSLLGPLYKEWNTQVNVVSRKDIDNIYLHHILHSLGIAKQFAFAENTSFLDLGTGGGLPGIPLAILLPECQFVLIDGTAKKIKVANALIEKLELTNCKALHRRSEEMTQKFDFVLARAVTRLKKLIGLSMPLISKTQQNAIPNGLITLKGGNLLEELQEIKKSFHTEVYPLNPMFEETFFETKYMIYVQK